MDKNRYNGIMQSVMDHSNLSALVIGAASLDVVGRLDTVPDPDTTNPAQIRVSYGGVARNVAENLIKLGQSVNFISVVGNDETGRHLIGYLENLGIGTSGCITSLNHSTGIYLAILSSDGNRDQALADRQVMDDLTPEFIRAEEDLFRQASIVFLDANLCPDTIKTIIQIARKHHIPICADPASTSLAGRLKPYLKYLELFTPNAFEAADLCKMDHDIQDLASNIQAARKLVDFGVKTAIITMGEFGVCYATAETNGHIPAITNPIIDPTGAGDAFTAAILYAYLNDIPIDEGIRLGVSAESLTLRTLGSVVPDLSLEKLYDNLII
jgi:pseudouridine kinase